VSRFSIDRIRKVASRPLVHHLETLSWYYRGAEYLAFTRRHALDFDGFIPREELVTQSTEALPNSNNYRAYTNFHLKPLLQEAMSTGIRFTNFIDVGCGKGLPCIFARKYFGFSRVYGIDFSDPLIEIAKRNAEKTSYDNVFFEVADATHWKVPDGDSIVFLNNPFNDVVLKEFLLLNLAHFTTHRSLIAYGNDLHRQAMCRLGFEVIFRSNRQQQSILRYIGSPAH
jgi:SAM-dependent methyltransferase